MSDSKSKKPMQAAFYLAWEDGEGYQKITSPSGKTLYIRVEENVSIGDAFPREGEYFLNSVYV